MDEVRVAWPLRLAIVLCGGERNLWLGGFRRGVGFEWRVRGRRSGGMAVLELW